eukprot:6021943-Amphidinium_carterae.1
MQENRCADLFKEFEVVSCKKDNNITTPTKGTSKARQETSEKIPGGLAKLASIHVDILVSAGIGKKWHAFLKELRTAVAFGDMGTANNTFTCVCMIHDIG